MFLFLNSTHHQFFTLALIDKNGQILVYKKKEAEYKQSEKLLTEINRIVGAKNLLPKLKGIIVASGPGGFTSLRIGLATANALAFSLQIPIVGIYLPQSIPSRIEPACRQAEDSVEFQDKYLIKLGINKLKKTKNFKPVLPNYGSEPHITLKK